MPIIIALFGFCLLFPVEALASEAGYWSELVFYIRTQQQAFHRELASAIRALQDGGLQAIWAMVGVSFLYGVFHAAGPGHGKAIISTYLLSHESLLKRGIFLSFASAFVQGLSAIILVEGLVGIIGLSRSTAKDAVPILEMVSFGLIGLIGLMLMVRAGRAFLKKYKTTSHHDHHHDHEHTHEDGHCNTCGHAHAPSAEMLTQNTRLRDSIAIILSIGIRPCSGSVLVLIFAEIVGLRWGGIASIFAISFGTALTVSGLAILAVYFRKGALMLAEKQSSALLERLSLGAAFVGGLFITLLGTSLLIEASNTSHPLF
ncbi:High-affinity nickel-transporter [Candidatus Terasakiella magnetica]|uniref:Nickel/cobalt efflux system n=1 Tax=Candidatus Terasakiella magnetica TaxID=1867952 RepID=A0A1C3RFE9_9PROT|nr:nickel/cobalt transporter [Candidatus Terasakiella magnetica]SCA55981.1 High-affinity nickel-transporter [Candidatus Terasakiella magnetica]